ncbi:MAG: polysaccharide pyruvyl transferase family protein [Candidatus Absconditabacterales bacterium]|nr:polysaccharide pyruvyl transferase family protein [Candidatus Absconditabacterales bacterium]
MDLNKQLKIEGKKVLIVGNRSHKNLGDELILLGTIKLLQEQGKKIYISAYNIAWLKSFFKQFINIEELTFLREIPKGFRSFGKFIKDGGKKTIKKYREMDSIIIGGGEILTEELPNNYRYWLVSILPCIKKQKNIYLMGGVQIPKKRYNKKLFSFLLKKTKYIYARDLDSVYGLKKYGFENTEFFMDTSFFAYDWNAIKNNNHKKQKQIIVNINKNGENFLENISNDIKDYLSNGYKILYVPVAKGRNNQYNDMQYYKQIKEKHKKYNNSFEILDWENNFDDFIKEIAKSELVISTRLHLFLISSFISTKTKVYPYQKKILKMQEVLKNLNID